MAIYYDVPSIGSEETNFAQKGGTCWYYASKMLLKFHHKLDNKHTKLYQEWKSLHEIRKVMTDAKADDGEAIAKELARLSKSMAGYADAIAVLEAKGVKLKDSSAQDLTRDEKSLIFMKDSKIAARGARIDAAIKTLDEVAERDSARLNLLQSFVPTAEFKRINKEQYDSPGKVVDLLERWGPFYTGGTVVACAQNRHETNQTLGGAPIVSVSEFNKTGSHAIVVVGANENTVFYKDPQKTDQVRSMNMDTFHKGLDVDASDFLIAISCNVSWNPQLATCKHMREGKRYVVSSK